MNIVFYYESLISLEHKLFVTSKKYFHIINNKNIKI